MKRKKKKVSAQQAKQEYGTRLKIYKQKIFHFLKLIDCEEVQALISKDMLQDMYRERNDSLPKIRHFEGAIVDRRSIRHIQADLDALISEKPIEIGSAGAKARSKDITSYIGIIYRMVKAHEHSFDANVLRIVKQFMVKYPELNGAYKKANQEIIASIWFLGLTVSRLNERFCWMERMINTKGANSEDFSLRVMEKIPQSINVVIDSNPRPVYRLAMTYPNAGLIEVSVSSDKLNLDNAVRNMPIPVYIQNHVLHRMEERLDSIPRYLREFYLIINMQASTVIHFKGRILVEYNVGSGNKLGYLIVEYLSGILLVKTFLLLSNSGTPEGQQLEEVSGMNKIDRAYWTIDRLSTFQNSDIKDHPKVKEVFEKSGCGSLFHDLPILDHDDETHSSQAAQMLKYLKMDEVNEQ